METELKLRFTDARELTGFLADPWLTRLTMPGSRVETRMVSHYLDTAEKLLDQKVASLRLREEGDARVLTVKTGSDTKNGLHRRLEWSLDIDGDWPDVLRTGLDVDRFCRDAVSRGDSDQQLRVVLAGIEGRPLIEICQVCFTRTAFDVMHENTLMELALDFGELRAGSRVEPFFELELELKKGDVRDLKDLGEKIAARFFLMPEPLSKFARCLALINGQSG